MTSQPIDRAELQRLIDGRLTAEERDMLLECAGDEAEAWRTIALAFVEEQVLREQVASPTVSRARKAAKPVSRRRLRSLMVTASGLMILTGAFLAGRMTVEQGTAITQPEPPDAPSELVVSEPPEQSNPWETAMRVMSTPMFNEESRRLLREHGYAVEEEPVIYMVEDESGKRYAMPHRKVSLTTLAKN